MKKRMQRFYSQASLYPSLVFSLRPGLVGNETIPHIEAEILFPESDRAKLKNYCSLFSLPASNRLPPLFPHLLTTPLFLKIVTDKQFPLPALGLLHTRQVIIQHRLLYVEDELPMRCYVEGHRSVRQGVEFDLVTEVYSKNDLLWKGISTMLSRGRGISSQKTVMESPPISPLKTAQWVIPANAGRRYAMLSGDFNPIHLYAVTAHPFGFDHPIVHGMWTCSRAVAEITELLPKPPMRIDTIFRKPVFFPGKARFYAVRDGQDLKYEVRSEDNQLLHLAGTVQSLKENKPQEPSHR